MEKRGVSTDCIVEYEKCENWYEQEDRDDVRQIESHSGQSEDSISGDGASKIKQAGNDSSQSGEPDSTEGSHGPLADMAEVSSIGET